jgi:CRISPR/Cas system CSM-associated protein Csm3 (group 7 of RAMP superfamily)
MQAVNELNLTLRIITQSPLLIIEPRYGKPEKEKLWQTPAARAGKPDRIPLSRASRDAMLSAVYQENKEAIVDGLNALAGEFYIPGSSMRGAWRAHLERRLRGIDPPASPKVCDPLAESGEFKGCSSALQKSGRPYAESCPVCRLFGSLAQGSRLLIGDGEPAKFQGSYPGTVVERNHVRIDRRRGSVAEGSAPLSFYGLQGAHFQVNIRVRNFELDHLFLLKLLLDDLKASSIPLGSGKNKGYGKVLGFVEKAELVQCGLQQPDDRLRGIGEISALQASHGLRPYPENLWPTLPTGAWRETLAWRWVRVFARTAAQDQITPFLEAFSALEPEWKNRWPGVSLLSSRAPELEQPPCQQ